jgi:methylenetetrahydrofolate dehydrogenase (NADP+) / methenyltetrahydrofolate cyclohydrolase
LRRFSLGAIVSPMITLDGRKVRDSLVAPLRARALALSRVPTLALFQIGDNPASTAYINQKKAFAERVGATVVHRHFTEGVSFAEVAEAIRSDNADDSIDGIILQLPVPPHIDGQALIELISPVKDVDGLTNENQRLLAEGRPGLVPATARAVMFILDFYGIAVAGMKVAVLGRSRLVGAPAALLLAARGANVTVCHSKTENTREVTRAADIVVVAIGKPGLIGADYIKPGATVVDVGITRVDGRLVGDVDHPAVGAIAGALTPVPGGVGPVTVLSLFDTLVQAAENTL